MGEDVRDDTGDLRGRGALVPLLHEKRGQRVLEAAEDARKRNLLAVLLDDVQQPKKKRSALPALPGQDKWPGRR